MITHTIQYIKRTERKEAVGLSEELEKGSVKRRYSSRRSNVRDGEKGAEY